MSKHRRSEAIWVDARNRWQINVQRDGKRKTFTSSTPGRKGKHEAEAKADDWLEAGQPDDIRFDAAWAQYLEHVKATTGTSSYVCTESVGRIWLLPALGGKKLSRITLSDVQSIINTASAKGRAYDTCRDIKRRLLRMLNYCVDNKMIGSSAFVRKVTIPATAPKGKKEAVQPDQIRIVFSCDTEFYRKRRRFCFYIYAFRFFILSGVRSGELCGFRREDFDGRTLTIRHTINSYHEIRDGKNDNALRVIPLTSYALKVLQDQLAMLDRLGIHSPWIFPDDAGKQMHPHKMYQRWKFYATQHGIDVSVHELRHTFISMTQRRMPMPLLKRIVGHSASMDTGGVYGHEMDDDLQIALDSMESILDTYIG